MAVTLPADVLRRYRRFSLYNSPFVAHDEGRAVDLYPAAGDGTGTVVETGDTWARLDRPAHPAPGEAFVGLPHYDGGGLIGGDAESVTVAGSAVGTADDRTVAWDDVRVLANGHPVTGLACFCARDSFGVKLVGEDVDLNRGDEVRVTVERSGRGDAE